MFLETDSEDEDWENIELNIINFLYRINKNTINILR
jgi:hypothetical protein